MATTQYFEENLYPVGDDGKADTSKPADNFKVFVSSYFANHQIYLRITDENRNEKTLHLTKEQASAFSEALDKAESSIGYDNT